MFADPASVGGFCLGPGECWCRLDYGGDNCDIGKIYTDTSLNHSAEKQLFSYT